MKMKLGNILNEIRGDIREDNPGSFDMGLFKETIGGEERCTNTVLASMGVCHNEPIMNVVQLKNVIDAELDIGGTVTYSGTKSDERKRDVFFLYPLEGEDKLIDPMEDGELKDVYPHSYKKGSTKTPPGLPFPYDTGIIKIRTVNNLIGKVKNEGPIGSYLVAVRDHVLVIHKVSDGTVYVVDTESKFRSKAVVRQLIYMERDPSDALFEWMSNKPERSKDIVLTI